MALKTREVTTLPNCCRCEMQGGKQTGKVRYDTRITTLDYRWGYLCQSHYTYEGEKSSMVTKLKVVK